MQKIQILHSSEEARIYLIYNSKMYSYFTISYAYIYGPVCVSDAKEEQTRLKPFRYEKYFLHAHILSKGLFLKP